MCNRDFPAHAQWPALRAAAPVDLLRAVLRAIARAQTAFTSHPIKLIKVIKFDFLDPLRQGNFSPD